MIFIKERIAFDVQGVRNCLMISFGWGELKSCGRSVRSVRDLASATVGSGDWCSLLGLGVISPEIMVFVKNSLSYAAIACSG